MKMQRLWLIAPLAVLGLSAALLGGAQPRATAVQPVTDDMRIDYFLEAKLAFDDAVPGDPYAGFASALTNPNTTVQWGWLDPAVPPKLLMNSGETVAVETMMHSHNLIQPGTPMSDIVALRLANPGGGPHTVTGPIYVNEAQPGDVMEIRIKKIVTKGFGANFNLPGSQFPGIGALNDQAFAAPGFVKYFFFEPDKRKTEFKPGVNIDLKPFPGTLAVGIDPRDPSARRPAVKGGPTRPASLFPMAPVSTLRPYKNGSNMDLNELGAGSTVYIPIFLEGGLVWTGDSHCRQGNGEVNLTALECSYDHIVFQLIVRKDLNWQTTPWREWPMAETKTHWILMGFADGSEATVPGAGPLDKAFRIAIENTVEFLATQGLTKLEAYSVASMVADCRVTQVVDVRRGVHCMVPKHIFADRRSGQAS